MRKDDVRQEFGKHAESYRRSVGHAEGASLKRLVELVQPEADWSVLDIATGAGHTAFAFAPHVREVLATDITPEMLAQTVKGAAERALENVTVAHAEAEDLPYPADHFDLVTCRIAPHHFSDLAAFVRESARVLRSGGILAVVDNIVPEGAAGAYVNAFEKLRDLSHGRCLSAREWVTLIEGQGLDLKRLEKLRKQMSFSFWAQRHGAEMQSYLRAMLDLATGEAFDFLGPAIDNGDLVFHLEEGLFIAKKNG